jgi:peptide/nickel transport system permease protein
MSGLILRKVLSTVPTLFIISLIIFTSIEIIPGDSIDVIYGIDSGVDEETRSALERQLGLDQPFVVRYSLWFGRLLAGDWGNSYISNYSVIETILNRVVPTTFLTLSSLFIALMISIPLSIRSAINPNGFISYFTQFIVLASLSIPSFLIGIIFLALFSLYLGWFPSYGYIDPFIDLGEAVQHVILPAVTLSLPLVAIQIRLLRDNLIHELSTKQYIQAGRAKGLRERTIIFRHAVPNVLLPVLTATSLWLGFAISGSVVVETIFTWPGLGYLLYQSVLNRDFPTVQGVTLVITVSFVTINLLTDIVYMLIDPRIKGI